MEQLLEKFGEWFVVFNRDIGWVSEVFTIIFISLMLRFFQVKFFRRLVEKAEQTHNVWDDAILHAVNKPLGYMIWLLGFLYAAEIVQAHVDVSNKVLFAWIDPARQLLMLILVSWAVVRFITRTEKNITTPKRGRKTVNKTTALAVGRFLRIAVFVTTGLLALENLNILPDGGLMAMGGASTFVIGFASKDLLANFFGGLMVFMDRPFAVGDWIRSPDRTIEGTVEHIGWRTTRIRQFDKRPLYVPNSVFTNVSLENPSRMTHRRIREVVGLRYKDADKIPVIMEAIEKMLGNHAELEPSQTTFVVMNGFGESTLNCLVYCFTKTTEWVPFMKVQQDVFVKISQIVREHGGDMAFPTTTLDFAEETVQALTSSIP